MKRLIIAGVLAFCTILSLSEAQPGTPGSVPTPIPTPTASPIPAPTPSPTPTHTPSPTATPTPSPSPTPTPSVTPTPTPIPTAIIAPLPAPIPLAPHTLAPLPASDSAAIADRTALVALLYNGALNAMQEAQMLYLGGIATNASAQPYLVGRAEAYLECAQVVADWEPSPTPTPTPTP